MNLAKNDQTEGEVQNLLHNFQHIQQRIEAACRRVGRAADEVTLLPVTKTLPAERVEQAFQLGYHSFGENKVLEAKGKHEALQHLPIRWLLIGHLQTNKIKYVAQFVDEFHALDSLRVAEKLNQRLLIEQRRMAVLVQVNTSNEQSKFGVLPEQALALVAACQQFEQLDVVGLMTLALHSQEEQEVRRCFQCLRQLRDQIAEQYPQVQRLSMGMSGDFEIAIEEGATDIRVGQAIFGARAVPDRYYWPE